MSDKRGLRDLLLAGRLEDVAAVAFQRKRALGSLISLTYDADSLVVWRAIEAMGLSCVALSDRYPEVVQQHMRRLHWLITEESGAICWRAPEAMADIVARLPDLLVEYVPIVQSLIHEFAEEDLEHFRGGAIWAIGRLGPVGGEGTAGCLPDVVAALDDDDPQVRGVAVWCLGSIGEGGVVADHPELGSDKGKVQLYEDRMLVDTSVGALAARLLVGV